ncbi:NAD(P)H-dependent oxidoreductase [Sphingopyxis sp. CCNWLW253]|uniref:NADPH-dependent FMN reductase n=1 Tax=unclassified Sphingopyxis TaxID=2614943 RepID=UPI003012B80D
MQSTLSDQPRTIVGIGGTFSAQSTSERLVRAVLLECERLGARTQMFSGAQLAALPHFNPEAGSGRTSAQSELVEAVSGADGIVIGSPGYHGGYSGLVKNAIDLLEDLRADDRVYFDGRPVGLVVTAAGWPACGTTLSALRDVVHAMRGWPTPVGVAINSVEQRPFAEDGSLADPSILAAVRTQALQIMGFCLAPAG